MHAGIGPAQLPAAEVANAAVVSGRRALARTFFLTAAAVILGCGGVGCRGYRVHQWRHAPWRLSWRKLIPLIRPVLRGACCLHGLSLPAALLQVELPIP